MHAVGFIISVEKQKDGAPPISTGDLRIVVDFFGPDGRRVQKYPEDEFATYETQECLRKVGCFLCKSNSGHNRGVDTGKFVVSALRVRYTFTPKEVNVKRARIMGA